MHATLSPPGSTDGAITEAAMINGDMLIMAGLGSSGNLLDRMNYVEAVEIHYLVPGSDEVVHELWL